MKSSLYTLAYAAVLGSVCALVLTGVGVFTAPHRKANARAEEIRNILGVLQVPHEPGLTPEGLLEVFARNIDMEDRGGLELYLYRRERGRRERGGPVGPSPDEAASDFGDVPCRPEGDISRAAREASPERRGAWR